MRETERDDGNTTRRRRRRRRRRSRRVRRSLLVKFTQRVVSACRVIFKTHDLSLRSLLVPAPVDKLGRLGWPPECVLAKTETLAAALPHFRRRHKPGVGTSGLDWVWDVGHGMERRAAVAAAAAAAAATAIAGKNQTHNALGRQ